MPGCDVVAAEKPQVWRGEDGWVCTQTTICRKCNMVDSTRLAEDVAWSDAVLASTEGWPLPQDPEA